MSISGAIERNPARSSRRFIQSGVIALASTPVITRPMYRPQAFGAEIATAPEIVPVMDTGEIFDIVNLAPVAAAKSRATPIIERQSPRFGVIFNVK